MVVHRTLILMEKEFISLTPKALETLIPVFAIPVSLTKKGQEIGMGSFKMYFAFFFSSKDIFQYKTKKNNSC